ncbi:hypothetical protein DAERI_060125 [Deinococcus aerius]|uniref:Uncharacterized protein n=1 Tax=Deinococcus aerius TaxID=200253 RepID=A0A2I9DYC5_9DEIO|nr:hypothetical protein [Deinococcus aerius]GBF05865.1 hypothetical protein DAERI_060125 [Deinococcus aerius]
MTDATTRPTLPTLALDYEAGLFTNTLTGEFAPEISGIVLAYREGRTLWPSEGEQPRLPLCVDGNTFGPPCPCPFADWGRDGTPPECAEELTLLLWQDEPAQVVTMTARRSMLKVIDQYLNMKALLGGTLHDQRITLRMTRGDGLHRLTLLPGPVLEQVEQARLGGVAERVTASGLWEGL